MSNKLHRQEEAQQRLRQYLTLHKLRHTEVRFAVLLAACSIDGYFTFDELREQLKVQGYNLSLSTLYTTTALLVQANLLIRHPFSASVTTFECVDPAERTKAYSICNQCLTVTRIADNEASQRMSDIRPKRFTTTHRVLYFYGLCSKCEQKQRRARQLTLNI